MSDITQRDLVAFERNLRAQKLTDLAKLHDAMGAAGMPGAPIALSRYAEEADSGLAKLDRLRTLVRRSGFRQEPRDPAHPFVAWLLRVREALADAVAHIEPERPLPGPQRVAMRPYDDESRIPRPHWWEG